MVDGDPARSAPMDGSTSARTRALGLMPPPSSGAALRSLREGCANWIPPCRRITLGSCDTQHQQARVTTLVAGLPVDHRFQLWFEATGGPQIAPGVGGD
jgi:hypothetical protein